MAGRAVPAARSAVLPSRPTRETSPVNATPDRAEPLNKVSRRRDGYVDLRSYAALGNGRTVALVAYTPAARAVNTAGAPMPDASKLHSASIIGKIS